MANSRPRAVRRSPRRLVYAIALAVAVFVVVGSVSELRFGSVAAKPSGTDARGLETVHAMTLVRRPWAGLFPQTFAPTPSPQAAPPRAVEAGDLLQRSWSEFVASENRTDLPTESPTSSPTAVTSTTASIFVSIASCVGTHSRTRTHKRTRRCTHAVIPAHIRTILRTHARTLAHTHAH